MLLAECSQLGSLMDILEGSQNWDWGTEVYSQKQREHIMKELQKHLEQAIRVLGHEPEEVYKTYEEINK